MQNEAKTIAEFLLPAELLGHRAGLLPAGHQQSQYRSSTSYNTCSHVHCVPCSPAGSTSLATCPFTRIEHSASSYVMQEACLVASSSRGQVIVEMQEAFLLFQYKCVIGMMSVTG